MCQGKGIVSSHFVLVQLYKGIVTAADNIWIGQTEDGQAYQHDTENLISSNIEDGRLKRTCFLAFDQTQEVVQTPLAKLLDKPTSKQEL